MGVGEVVLEHIIGGSVGNRTETKGRLDRPRVGQPLIFEAGEVGEFLSRDHESGL